MFSSLDHWVVRFSPVLPCGIGLVTFLMCFVTAHVFDHIPNGLWAPVISLLGCKDPEHTFYQIGFGLTGLSIVFLGWTFKQVIAKPMKANGDPLKTSRLLMIGYSSLYLSGLGITLQGVVTLQEDAFEAFILDSTSSSQTDLEIPTLKLQSIFHQLFALLFFLSAFVHSVAVTCLYFKSSDRSIIDMKTSRILKLFLIFFPFLFQIFAFAFHPTLATAEDSSLVALNFGGVSQWISVVAYFAFFGVYLFDFKTFLAHRHYRTFQASQNHDLQQSEMTEH